ncbi:WD domain [Trypanosoma brucei equiperdum]|uniref:WD domain n=1 Tax=Trypanosoma brucei equiperdum TaxID=630700 RepID=A0A3L6L6J9_9TRYP|nr:WD domain [Trypanosoma brucei equiperdum]
MLTSTAYGMELQARAIAPFYHSSNNSSSTHRFVAGTACFAGGNVIRLLTFQEESQLLECTATWSHEEEMFGLWSSPSVAGPSLLAVGASSHCRIFRVSDDVSGELEPVVNFNAAAAQVLWDLEGLQNEVKLISEDSLRIYSLAEGKMGEEIGRFRVDGCAELRCAALDPHHSSVCLAAGEGIGIAVIDTRRKGPIVMPNTTTLHGLGMIQSIDFSNAREGLFMTAGTDGVIMWHDFRMDGEKSVVERRGYLDAHDHCVQRSLFNPFHDELLISCGSDHTLKLWDTSKKGADGECAVCVSKLSDFAESVVACCWSNSNPWVFAGLSYNGRVLVDSVPEECKMQFIGKEG